MSIGISKLIYDLGEKHFCFSPGFDIIYIKGDECSGIRQGFQSRSKIIMIKDGTGYE